MTTEAALEAACRRITLYFLLYGGTSVPLVPLVPVISQINNIVCS